MSTSFSQRIQSMIDDLQANPQVKILELTLNPPASSAEIETAIDRANGALPPGVAEFFGEMNGFHVLWEQQIESSQDESTAARGCINILPIGEVFRNWKGTTWFKGVEGGDRFKGVKPLDLFAPEACAAFCQSSEDVPDGNIYFHYFGEELQNTYYSFLEYFDRVLAARGYWYWIASLCEECQENPEVIDFRTKMPLIFPDYQDELFYPKSILN